MRVTKFGHCCLLIEENGLRILTDPGSYTTAQTEVKDLDIILITHEHPDHLHTESLKTAIQNNPQARVITNAAVGKLLDEAGIKYEVINDKDSITVKDVLIEAREEEHAVIYPTLSRVRNTGFLFANKFFYPGDAFIKPGKPIEILALPVAGPWVKISDAIDYALELQPKRCFPVHDGMLKSGGPFHLVPPQILGPKGIAFEVIEEGQDQEY